MAVTIPVQFNCNSSRISFDQKGIAGPLPTLSLGLNLSIPIPALVEALADFQRQHDPWGQIPAPPPSQAKSADVNAKQAPGAKVPAGQMLGKQPAASSEPKVLQGVPKTTWQQAPPPPLQGNLAVPGKAFPGQAAPKSGAVPGQTNPASMGVGTAAAATPAAARVGTVPATAGPTQPGAKAVAKPGAGLAPGAVRPAPGLQAPETAKPEDATAESRFTEDPGISDAVTLLDAASGRRWDACSFILAQPTFTGVNAKSRFGRTVLHYAAWDGRADICKALIERPDFTEVNAKECYGRTALHCAALTGHADVCRLLLSHPGFTELDARDRIGNLTAIDLALRCGHAAALEALRETVSTTYAGGGLNDAGNADASTGTPTGLAVDVNAGGAADGSKDGGPADGGAGDGTK